MSPSRPSPRTIRARHLASAAATALCLVSSPLYAQVSWSNTAGGVFSTGGNWTGGVAPTVAQSALFAIANTYPVTFTTSPTTSGLFVNAGTVSFQTNGVAQSYNA